MIVKKPSLIKSKIKNKVDCAAQNDSTEAISETSAVSLIDWDLLELAAIKLSALLEEERNLVASNQLKAAMLLKEQKEDLVNFLSLYQKHFQENQNIGDLIPKNKKASLKSLFAKLTEAAENNLHEIVRKQFLAQHVLKLISKSVDDEKNKFVGYDTKGKKKSNKRPMATTPHVSINQEI